MSCWKSKIHPFPNLKTEEKLAVKPKVLVFSYLTLITSPFFLGVVSPQEVTAQTYEECSVTPDGHLYVYALERVVLPEEYKNLNDPCGILNNLPEEGNKPSTLDSRELAQRAERLKQVAIQAARNNRRNCSGSVREAAKKLGIDLSVQTAGPQANNQVDYMEKNWRKVSAQEAKELAEQGVFVVAGRKNYPHGHVAVVVTGRGAIKPNPVTGENRVWPNIAGGSLGGARSYSEGNKTVYDVWGRSQLSQVRYYTPD